MGPADFAVTSFQQLPGMLHGAVDILLGFLSPSQVDSNTKSTWRLEFAPPPKLVLPLSRQSSALTTSNQNWDQLSGTWIKDKRASDSMEPVLQLMQMRGLVRQAIKLVKGLNIKHKDDCVIIEVFSVIGWFKVVERYKLNGESAFFRRRDLRKGQHQGNVRVLTPPHIRNPMAALKPAQDEEQQQEGSCVLDLRWGEPHSGSGWDVYELKAPDLMHVTSTVIVGEEAVKTTSIFNRKR